MKNLDSRLLELHEMLTYCRPDRSQEEVAFIRKYITSLIGWCGHIKEHKIDGYGNVIITVGEGSEVLWSSHTDTVHWKGGMQKVVFDPRKKILRLASRSKSTCLGADCTTGVWLMRNMIIAGVKGTYVFHRAEERGAKGSQYIAKNDPSFLEQFKYAIAFDRKALSSVITHQMSARCCSDAFARSLAAALPVPNVTYVLDDGGSFTDTAYYTEHIGECTNLSVGYYAQHTKGEIQDYEHALKLLDVLEGFDENVLVHSRQPGEVDPFDNSWGYGSGTYTGSYRRFGSIDPNDMYGLVCNYPHSASVILEELGVTTSLFNQCITARAMGKSIREVLEAHFNAGDLDDRTEAPTDIDFTNYSNGAP